jgi:AraC family transcriptional regulator
MVTARAVLPLRRLKMLTDFIQANLGNAITLAGLASMLGMSQSQLVRAFRASTGYTPIEYVARRRIKEARRLLASTSVPVSQIAIGLGFADQSHFTRRFRLATGVTPARFRRLAL